MPCRLAVVVLAVVALVGPAGAREPDPNPSVERLDGFEAPRAYRGKGYDEGGAIPRWQLERRGFYVASSGDAQRRLLAACRARGSWRASWVTCPVYLYEQAATGLRLIGRGEVTLPDDAGTASSRRRAYVVPKGLRYGVIERHEARGGFMDYLRPARARRDVRAQRWYVSPERVGDAADLGAHARSFLEGKPWAGMREEHLLAMLGGALDARDLEAGAREYRLPVLDAAFTVRGGVLVSVTARGGPVALEPTAPTTSAPTPAAGTDSGAVSQPTTVPAGKGEAEARELMGEGR